jgi:membrane protein implicated in regulation of membrane protease activity
MDSAIVWFLVGLGLVLAEFAAPGVILVFIGVAAWIVAILDWFGVDSFSAQLWIFGLVSVGLLVFLRRFVKSWFTGKESSGGSDVDEEFVGQVVSVVEPIENGGFGLVELKGAQWKAVSDSNLKEGDSAEVVERDNLTLKVVPRK